MGCPPYPTNFNPLTEELAPARLAADGVHARDYYASFQASPNCPGYQNDRQSDGLMMICRKLSISFASLAAVVVALLLAPVGTKPSQQAECSFAGIWRTTYGEMPLQQFGTSGCWPR